MRSRLRVVTYNIHRGLSPFRKTEVLDNIAAVLHSTGADILCLQEDIISEMFEGSELEWRCQEVWKNSVYGETVIAPGGSQGNTILSRFPVTDIQNLDISAKYGEARRALYCEIKLGPKKAVKVCCTHLGLTRPVRRAQASKLVGFLKELGNIDEPLLLAGDFNDWTVELSGFLQRQLNLLEAHFEQHGRHCATYPAWLPLLKLDRIYYRQMVVRTAWKISSFGGRGRSDHLPLVVDFEEF